MRTLLCVALTAGALLAPAADAAILTVTERQEWVAGGVISSTDLHFNGLSGEANQVLVLANSGGSLVQWVDTGSAIIVGSSARLQTGTALNGPEGCVPVRVTGTLAGEPIAASEATCARPGPFPDPFCQFNPYCQFGSVSGYAEVYVRTGDGDDVVRASDGRRERIDCGTGTDTVHADAQDVLANCEIRG